MLFSTAIEAAFFEAPVVLGSTTVLLPLCERPAIVAKSSTTDNSKADPKRSQKCESMYPSTPDDPKNPFQVKPGR